MPKDVAEERRTKREKSDSRRPYQLFISKPAFLRAIKSTSRVSECINSKLIKQTWKHEKLTVAEAGRELSTGTLRAALLIVKANFVIGFDEKCNDIDAPQPTWQSREGIVTGKLTHHCGREWRCRLILNDFFPIPVDIWRFRLLVLVCDTSGVSSSSQNFRYSLKSHFSQIKHVTNV